MARTNNLNDGWKSLVFEWSWTRWWPRVTRRTVVSTGVNHTFKVVFTPLEYVPTIPPLSSYVINIFTICRYWWRRMKSRNPEPKKWGLFATVGIYSSGIKMTLKVWFTPMETTRTIQISAFFSDLRFVYVTNWSLFVVSKPNSSIRVLAKYV